MANKTETAAAVTMIIAGAKKRFPNGSQTVTIENNVLTIDQITGSLQTIVTNRSAVVTAQATAKAKVAAERTQAPPLMAILVAFVTFIRLTFGESADALADFGLAPPKVPTPQTAEAKAVAAAKRIATRQARGTTSAKQKKSVKGNVTATLVVTPATPAPAAPVTPAPAASSATSAGAAPAATPKTT